MEWTYTHFRILFDAWDSSNLAELLFEVDWTLAGDPVPDDHWPRLGLEEARSALVDLLRVDYVALFGDRELRAEEAIRAAREDKPWSNEMPDTPGYYEVRITDAGRDAYMKEILPRHWPGGVVST